MDGKTYDLEAGGGLGRCPGCGETIPSSRLLIRYQTSEGWPRLFAECPQCTDVVHPQ